ncbi:MAG: 30S ribosomal protein S5 [Rickettsiaceae bacterium]
MNKNNKVLDDLKEVVAGVNRVTKVVKGGRKFSFSACVIVGNRKGKVGHAHSKATEISDAKIKASKKASRNLIAVKLHQDRTICRDVIGTSGAAKVLLRTAKPGTGIIAGSAMRSIFDLLGIKDIVAKSIGSSNVYSMIDATFDALSKLSSPNAIAKRRGKKVSEIYVTVPKA